MTVKEFLILVDVASNSTELLEQIKVLPKPSFVEGIPVPDSLNDLTIGQLMELQSITETSDYLFVPCRVLLGFSHDKVKGCKAEEVLALSTWVANEVERIAKLFESTSIQPTQEEKRAGVDKLSFGLFGLIDYYAIRMGITDHEFVESVPWIRVYKCLDMDAEKMRYERRLRVIYQKQQ